MKGKRILAWFTAIISAFILAVGMSGCKAFEYDGNFFDKKHLEEHLIPDLPKPDAKVEKDVGEAIKYEMTEEEFEQYAREVYNYMLSCNFQKLGTPGSIYATDSNSRVHDCAEFEEYKHDGEAEGHTSMYSSYLFACANERYERNEERWVSHFLNIEYYQEGSVRLGLCDHIGFSIYD